MAESPDPQSPLQQLSLCFMSLAASECQALVGRRCGGRGRLLKKSRRWRLPALGRRLAPNECRDLGDGPLWHRFGHRERQATPAAPKSAPSPIGSLLGDAANMIGGLRQEPAATFARPALRCWPSRLLASGHSRCASRPSGLLQQPARGAAGSPRPRMGSADQPRRRCSPVGSPLLDLRGPHSPAGCRGRFRSACDRLRCHGMACPMPRHRARSPLPDKAAATPAPRSSAGVHP